jgi:putative pyruvate formate lyase activating enzyme
MDLQRTLRKRIEVSEMTTTEATSTRNPGYLDLLGSGVLKERVRLAGQHLEQCDLCARYCRVNRLKTTEGAICQTGEQALVYSFGAHYGEEQPISGWMGSGAIFFGRCNLHCVYCQNWEISQTGAGRSATPDQIALIMLALQKRGCHNINLVSPSHVVAQIVSAIFIAAQHGLHIPLVYNTGGYDSLEALQLLDGIIDIYMPDMKYGSSTASRRLSGVSDYPDINRAAVREMHRQVGDLVLDSHGLAVRGLLVRHLVLPGDVAGSNEVLDFIAKDISPLTYVNLMDQYYPWYRAEDFAPLDRSILRGEYRRVLDMADRHGLRRVDEHRERRRLGI